MWVHADRHEWVEADQACASALANATEPRAQGISAGFLTLTGRPRRALAYLEAARSNDPLSTIVAVTVARQYSLLDMGPQLEAEYQRIQDMGGTQLQGYETMLFYLMHSRAPVDRIAEVFSLVCKQGPPGCDGWAAAIRSPEKGPAILRAGLTGLSGSEVDWAGRIALSAAYLGDRDLALDALEVFGRTRNSASYQVLWFPLLGDVRKDPRFKRIVERIGFPELWRRTGQWPDVCRPIGEKDFECH